MNKYLIISVLAAALLVPAISFADDASTTPSGRHPLLQRIEDHMGQYGSTTPMGPRPMMREDASGTPPMMREQNASSSPWGAVVSELRRSINGKGDAGSALDDAKARAQEEITRREQILQSYIDRLNGTKKISDEDKTTLIADLQSRLDDLSKLSTDINNSTGTSTLRTDIQTLKDDHKTFQSALPKVALTSAAERVLSVAAQLEAFSAKLQTRISDATTNGTDTSTLSDELTQMNADIASAKTIAQSALTAAATADSTTIGDVRKQIVTGQQDLQAARELAKKIVEALGVPSGNASSTAQ